MAAGGALLPFIGFGDDAIKAHLLSPSQKPKESYDAIIIGGSYSGLSAALTLARCLRNVLVIDAGNPRNRHAQHAHNAYALDGEAPSDIQKTALEQLSPYKEYLELLRDEAVDVLKEEDRFIVKTRSSVQSKAAQIVFATGASDKLPDIKGLQEQWGKHVQHCPYCHGFESRKGKTMLICEHFQGLEILPSLRHWCENLIVSLQAASDVPEHMIEVFEKNGIQWTNKRVIEAVSNKNGLLIEVIYEDWTRESVNHIYVKPITQYQTQWAEKLGCEKDQTQRIVTDEFMLTTQKGVYAVGDISSRSMGQIIWAANSGMLAAVDINGNMVSRAFVGK